MILHKYTIIAKAYHPIVNLCNNLSGISVYKQQICFFVYFVSDFLLDVMQGIGNNHFLKHLYYREKKKMDFGDLCYVFLMYYILTLMEIAHRK